VKRSAIQLEGLDIELRPLKRLGFEPANVVVGISTEGVVGPLVASHIIQQLGMDQVCAIESPMFPPTSMVYFRKPKFPARIYASKRHRLAVVLAEFGPLDDLARPLAYAILAWRDRVKAGRILGIESFAAGDADPVGVGVAAIGASARDRKAIAKAKVPEVQHGAVTGVAGVLLNEGRWRDVDVVTLMASLGAGPDSEAAVQVLLALQKLLPGVPVRAPEARREPTELEKAIRAAHERDASHEFI